MCLLHGSLDQPVDVGAEHGGFGGIRVHALEAAQLLQGFLLDFGRHLAGRDLLLELADLLAL